jgi:hypothetical protein
MPRESGGPSLLKKGGRGNKNTSSFEKGAEKGSVYQLLSRQMPDGTAVPEGKVRCVLLGSDVVLLTLTANNGEQNLWNHMETAHAITRFTGGMEKEKKEREGPEKNRGGGAGGDRGGVPGADGADESGAHSRRFQVHHQRATAI